MSRGRQASVQVQLHVGRLTREGFTPTQIHGELERLHWLDMVGALDVRTIQRMVRDITPADSSGPWSSTDPNVNADDARLVLDVVADVFGAYEGRVWLSKDQVAEIARVRQIAPDTPSSWAYGMALEYQLCKEEKRDSRHLDFILGMRPWGSAFGADLVTRALGSSRSIEINSADAPRYDVYRIDILMELVAFQGSIETLRTNLELEPRREPVPSPPEAEMD